MNKPSNKPNKDTYRHNLRSIISGLGEPISPSHNKSKIHAINPKTILAFEQNYLGIEHQSLNSLSKENKVSVALASTLKSIYIELRNENVLNQQDIKDYLWENKIEYPVKKEVPQEQERTLTDTFKNYENTIQHLADGIKSSTQTMEESNQLISDLAWSLSNQTEELERVSKVLNAQIEVVKKINQIHSDKLDKNYELISLDLINFKKYIQHNLIRYKEDNIESQQLIDEIQSLKEEKEELESKYEALRIKNQSLEDENQYKRKELRNIIQALLDVNYLLDVARTLCIGVHENGYDFNTLINSNLINEFVMRIYENSPNTSNNIKNLYEIVNIVIRELKEHDNKHLFNPSDQM